MQMATPTASRSSQMKWTSKHDIMLGRETLLFELWKYKSGSREKGQCLDKIAENLNEIKELYFNVNQKSVRDRLSILERAFKKKDRLEKNASGISPEEMEIDTIVEDYLERKDEQEKEYDKVTSEARDKAEKEKTSAETMRNMAMQRLSENKRSSEDRPTKKRKSSGNDTIHYLQEKAAKDYEIQKQTLDVKQKRTEAMAKQSELLMQQQQDMMKNFQQQLASQQKQSEQMMQMSMVLMQQQQQQNQALLGIIAKTDK